MPMLTLRVRPFPSHGPGARHPTRVLMHGNTLHGYQILSPGLAGTPRKALIHKEPRFSDHAPLIMDYRL